jgi:hypothetical protein
MLFDAGTGGILHRMIPEWEGEIEGLSSVSYWSFAFKRPAFVFGHDMPSVRILAGRRQSVAAWNALRTLDGFRTALGE